MSGYDQNEWATDWDDANAPTDAPADELDKALEYCHRRMQAIRNAHTSWNHTKLMLKEVFGIDEGME